MSPNPPRMRLMQRFLRFMSERRVLSDARMLELYPPFWFMRIKVLEWTASGVACAFGCRSMPFRAIQVV